MTDYLDLARKAMDGVVPPGSAEDMVAVCSVACAYALISMAEDSRRAARSQDVDAEELGKLAMEMYGCLCHKDGCSGCGDDDCVGPFKYRKRLRDVLFGGSHGNSGKECRVDFSQDGIPRCSLCQNVLYDEYRSDELKNYCDECGAMVRKEID